MIPITWRERVERAETIPDVVSAARDFVASLDPYEIHQLPRECRPAKFVDGEDISSYSLDIVRYHCEVTGEAAALSARLAEFFSIAAQRVGQLTAASNSEHDEYPRQSNLP